MRKPRKDRKTPIEKVLSRVEIGEAHECWNWPGATTTMGYGRVGYYENAKLKMAYPHRVMHEHFNGPIPEGAIVMHSCDNPKCCNPSHLSVGTNADNSLDMCVKERSRAGLTPKQVRDIRTAYEYGHSIQEIVTQVHPQYFEGYNNPRAAVWAIVKGHTYQWVAA